ncbi:MAG: NAD(P)H-hydrate dehydratase [Cryomorphaceae bacterium]|nr:NAD(P)H-hydrate dehydratase [Cryomorphaceae bacterium]
MADKLFQVEQIRQWDATTISSAKLSSLDLMERAAAALCRCLNARFPKAKSILFVCGAGNNGGDGLAMARILANEGKTCTVWFSGRASSADAEVNRERLVGSDVSIVTSAPIDLKFDLIVDAILGSGLKAAPKGEAKEMIAFVNQCNCDVFSVDLPSGLPADGIPDWECVHTTITATIQSMKRAFMLDENEAFTGEVEVVDIGLDIAFEKEMSSDWLLTKKADFADVFKSRSKFSHKGFYGHLAIVGGSEGMVGAAMLSALAAMRSGAALTSVYTTESGVDAVHAYVPEAIVRVAGQGAIKVFPSPGKYTAYAVGPGLGTRVDTAKHFAAWLNAVDKPLIVDADALNILSQYKEWLDRLPKNTIMTPHPGEFDRLFGEHKSSLDRISTAMAEAKERKLIIVLKGAFTRIACPDGSLYFNPTGNPGMATAGSGDALTGIIGSLLAQRYDPKTAAIAGVWLHGRAGDLAAEEKGEIGLIARDLINYLPQAFR